jgi:membrane protein required for colicin V production
MNTFAFTTVDFVVITILTLSAILGIMRGLVKEVLSLVIFGASMWLAYHYSTQLISWLKFDLPGGDISRTVIAFIAIFIVALLLGKIFSLLISRLISSAGLTTLDRLLGAAFGLIRGILIVIVISTLAALTTLPSNVEWKDALTRPAVEYSVSLVRSWLPPDWATKVSEATDIRNQ